MIDRLARGVIHLANATDWPITRWRTDPDIQRALLVLGWTVEQAKTTSF